MNDYFRLAVLCSWGPYYMRAQRATAVAINSVTGNSGLHKNIKQTTKKNEKGVLSARLPNVLNHLFKTLTTCFCIPENMWQNPRRLGRDQTLDITAEI